MRTNTLWLLLAIFAPLSFTTVGGGQSIVSEIHRQAVTQQAWLTQQQFITDFALSRLAPGPGSLLVTLIGWQVAGWQGALVASIAIFLPSSVLLYAIAHVWTRYRGAGWQRTVERGLAPVAAGLILAAAFTVVQASRGGWIAWAVAAASTLILTFVRVSPFYLLGAGALIFLATT